MDRLVDFVLACIVTVSGIWPLNIPLMALAYKVRHGAGPIPFEWLELWLRSLLGALGLALAAAVLVGLYWLLVPFASLPAEPVKLMLLVAYLPAGVWFLFWMFALEDMLEGLSLFLIYIFLPGFVLFLLSLLSFFPFELQSMSDITQWLQSDGGG
jgi:hypothetical protein